MFPLAKLIKSQRRNKEEKLKGLAQDLRLF